MYFISTTRIFLYNMICQDCCWFGPRSLLCGSIMSRKHVGRANSTIIGFVFFLSLGDWLPFVVNEKSSSRSGWEIAGVGKRKKLQAREAAGACPGLASWTSFCSGLAPVDRLAPRQRTVHRAARYRAGRNMIFAGDGEAIAATRLLSSLRTSRLTSRKISEFEKESIYTYTH